MTPETAEKEEMTDFKALHENKTVQIAQLVHDLRTPLHTLHSCLDLLESGFKKPEDLQAPMRRSTEALIKLVERLRDINHDS